MAKKRKGSGKRIKISLELEHLSHLPAADEHETLKTLEDFVSRSVQSGLIPMGMVPIAEDLLNAALADMDRSHPTANSILPESLLAFENTVGVSGTHLFIPPNRDVALYSLETRAFLLGGPGNVLFQVDDDEFSFTDFVNSEWFLPVIEEVILEIVLLAMHLMPGGHGAAGVAEKVAKKAAQNRTIRRLVKQILEDLMNYGTRGRGLTKLRKNLKALFIALTGMDLFADAMKEFFKGLSGWGIFLIFLDLLLAFTPAGWSKRLVVVLLSVGAITHALHTKYELWKKSQAEEEES